MPLNVIGQPKLELCNLEPQSEFPCGDNFKWFSIESENHFVSSNASESSQNNSGMDDVITEKEVNPFVEIVFQKERTIKGIQLCYEESLNVNEDLYLLMSRMPFSSKDLGQIIRDECVDYLQFGNQIQNCEFIEFEAKVMKHIKLQSGSETVLTYNSFLLLGGDEEICGNDIDDDCDGLFDCEDPDCIPDDYEFDISNSSECIDGFISFVNIDPSYIVTISPMPSMIIQNSTGFYDVPPGIYQITISNGFCFVVEQVVVEESTLEQSLCDNFDFAAGLSGWDLSFIDNVDFPEDIEEFDDGCNSVNFDVIASGTEFNSNIPIANPLPSPTDGDYILSLFADGEEGIIAEKCFTVVSGQECISFNFAMVQEDPNPLNNDGINEHDHKPAFQYVLYNKNTNIAIEEQVIISDDASFFPNFIEGHTNGRDWSPFCIDLTGLEGEELCMKFTVTGCSTVSGNGGHSTQVYIDNLCTDCENQKPKCEFEIPNFICENSFNIGYDVNNFEMFKIGILEGDFDNVEFTAANTLPDFNISDLALSSDISLECGSEYTLAIELLNDCGTCYTEHSFIWECSENDFLGYPDIMACDPSILSLEIFPTIQGCEGCSIQWENDLGNLAGVNSFTPIVLAFNNPEVTFNKEYRAIITLASGCEKEISFCVSTGINLGISVNEDYCCLLVNGTVTQSCGSLLSEDNFLVKLVDDISLEHSIITEYFNTDEVEQHCVDRYQDYYPTDIDLSVDVSLIESENLRIIGDCSSQSDLDSHCTTTFSQPWIAYSSARMALPTEKFLFYSLGVAANADECDPFYITNNPIEQEAPFYAFNLKIFDRAGSCVFTAYDEISDECSDGIHGSEDIFRWDGTFGGTYVQADTYVWIAQVFSCSDSALPPCMDAYCEWDDDVIENPFWPMYPLLPYCIEDATEINETTILDNLDFLTCGEPWDYENPDGRMLTGDVSVFF